MMSFPGQAFVVRLWIRMSLILLEKTKIIN